MNYSAARTSVSSLPPGIALGRFVTALALAKGEAATAADIAEQWRDSPQVMGALSAVRKTAVPGATTSDATWAGPLAGYGISAEVLTLIRGASILGAIEGRMRRVPFRVRVPREMESGTGGDWVGQGKPVPASVLAFDTLVLEPFKRQALIVLSTELLKMGVAGTERAITNAIVNALAAQLDYQLLDPTVTATTANPASITNGATEITSTGTTAAAMTADLNSMLEAIDTSGRALVWIMPPITMARIAATLGGAASDVPRTLFGLPLVTSSTSPAQITLADLGELALADDGDFDVQVSEHSTVEMRTDPTQDGAAGTGAAQVSLWQNDLFSIRASRYVSWDRPVDGSVAWMDVNYGSPS